MQHPVMASAASQAALFTATAFAGAVLLFWIQPLFAKMALPLLGGSALVWNTAMVFFQVMLLAGYAYAHVLTRLFRERAQLMVHTAVLALAALVLPVQIADAWQTDVGGVPPAAWLLALLFVSLGAPFFAVAATAPLLQRWFSRGRHPHVEDPYFLYAASNAGSVAVVLAFPFVLEPLLTTDTQSVAWAAGFGVLALGVFACGFAVRRGRVDAPQSPVASSARTVPQTDWRRRAGWLAYSAVPSGLLLGVTVHITTDIAPGPLLWVVPLALYLLSFVNAFARKPAIPHWLSARAAAFATVLLAAVFLWREPVGVLLPVHLGALFAVALACHGELARRRPPTAELTTFYLFVSLGGLAGGVSVALIAPVVLDRVLEYPLCLVLAAALLPNRDGARGEATKPGDLVAAASIAVVALGIGPIFDWAGIPLPRIVYAALLASLAALALARQGRPLGFALCIAALLTAAVLPPWRNASLWDGRSFFGVYRVLEEAEPPMRTLVHGNTIHGGQWTDDDGTVLPTTYLTRASPIVDVIDGKRAQSGTLRVGVAGVGTGALAYYRQRGDAWRYYEIDPLITWLATQSGYFEMLPRHDPDAVIVVGDARLGLASEPDGHFDLLILDAFSSDAVPTHLLTREAVVLYMNKLRPDGVLAAQISNRLLDLEPVFAGAVAELGYAARVGRQSAPDPETDPTGAASEWVLVGRNDAALDVLRLSDVWRPIDLGRQQRWRDDYSNLLGIIRWRGT